MLTLLQIFEEHGSHATIEFTDDGGVNVYDGDSEVILAHYEVNTDEKTLQNET